MLGVVSLGVARYGVAVSAVDEAGLSAGRTAGVGPVWLASGVRFFWCCSGTGPGSLEAVGWPVLGKRPAAVGVERPRVGVGIHLRQLVRHLPRGRWIRRSAQRTLERVELFRIRLGPLQAVRLVRRNRCVAGSGAGGLGEGADLGGLPAGPRLPGQNSRPVLLDLLLASQGDGRIPAAPLLGLTQFLLPHPAFGFRCEAFEICRRCPSRNSSVHRAPSL